MGPLPLVVPLKIDYPEGVFILYPEAPLERFPESLLKPCDIRGLTPDPLGPEQARRVGLATVVHLLSKGIVDPRVVVGADIRESSRRLTEALILGLRESGAHVVDAGAVSTPLLAYATRVSASDAGIMVTASHNPPEYNGFKFFLSEGSAPIPWIHELYEAIRRGELHNGAGSVERKDFLETYKEALMAPEKGALRDFPLVVDLGNGAAILTVPKVLDALGCRTLYLHADVDPSFSGRGPDSSHLPALAPLGESVRSSGAALGAAFDGDGDRITFVDDQGRPLPNYDAQFAIEAKMLERYGAKVVRI